MVRVRMPHRSIREIGSRVGDGQRPCTHKIIMRPTDALHSMASLEFLQTRLGSLRRFSMRWTHASRVVHRVWPWVLVAVATVEGGECDIIPQANAVTDLMSPGQHTIVLLGTKFTTPTECENACTTNSTARDPCHSWTFIYPDSVQAKYRGHCWGRHDLKWAPKTGIPISANHVCSAVSCQ
jgi:hypothetical protein